MTETTTTLPRDDHRHPLSPFRTCDSVRLMSRRRHAFPLFLLALFVVAACAVSFAHAADAGASACGAANGWGPAKNDAGQSAALLLELAAIPIGFIGPVPTMTSGVAPLERLALAVDHGPAQPPAPRAPPFA